jgi:isoleucyl-tRNA synthetase
MHQVASVLTKLLAPMIVFTADEAWSHIPHKPADESDFASVHMTLLPETSGVEISDQTRADWALLMQLRESALGQLDELKKQVGLNKASESQVTYHLPADVLKRFTAWDVDLEDAAGAGHFELVETTGAPSVKVVDARNLHAACARCWKRRPGVDAATQLCERCTKAVGGQPI